MDILPILRKGALVARDPSNYEDIDGPEALDSEEVECLRDEVLHKWRQRRPLYFTIICCSVGAAVQGWDQTGMRMLFAPIKVSTWQPFWRDVVVFLQVACNRSADTFATTILHLIHNHPKSIKNFDVTLIKY